jgi:hypothetical protein
MQALLAFQSTYGQAAVVTVSGTTLSFGNFSTFSSTSQDTVRVAGACRWCVLLGR